MASRELKVSIIGDSRSLQKALGSATDSTGKLGKAFSVLGKAAAGAGIAVAAGFVYTLKRGFDELGEAQKVSAQTAAGIKSTGAAANVTAKQVENLASSLSLMSGVDDEVIQQGENLLLTFTKVRNEVGKGNDVFNRATAAALDLSVRGFGSMDSSSKMLGKALQDPVKGITALSRAGVTFTAEQKEMIKGLVDTGRALDAQKLILKEVEMQVGGSAKAFGETLPGQLSKLRNAFDEMAAKLATKLLPALNSIVDSVNDNWPQIEKVITQVMDALVSGVGKAVSAVRTHFETIKGIAVSAFAGAKAAVQGFVSFIRSDFGQQMAISAAGILAVGKAVALLAPAVKVAMSAFALMGRSVGAALIPFAGIVAIGALVGELAGNFIEGKIAAMQLADAMDRASGSARGLKDSLDALKDANIGVKEAKLAHTAATQQAQAAELTWAAAVKQSGQGSAEAKAAYVALQQSLTSVERAELSVTEAVKRQGDAQTARNAKLREGEQALMKLTAEGGRANNTFAQSGAQERWAAAVKKIGDEAAITALKARNMGDEAGGRAAAKVALLAQVSVDLAEKLGRIPSRKEIIAEAKAIKFGPFYAELIKAQQKTKDAMRNIPKDVAAVAGPAGSAAAGIGSAITSGIESGFNFGGIIATVKAGVRAAIEAGKNAGSTTASIAKPIGSEHIIKPIEEGVKERTPKLQEVTAAAVRKAVGAAALAAATKELGGKMVQDIIDGIVGKQPSLKAQFATAAREAAEAGRQAIAAARQGYADAFAGLYQAGFDAIAAKYAGWVPPSLLKAQREAEEREKAQLLKSISDTQEELKTLIAQSSQASKDLQALGLRPADLGEGASAEAQKARADEQKKWDDLKAIIDTNGPKIVAAQENLDGLLFQQRQKALQEAAAQEQIEHDKRIAAEQATFAKRLQKIMASHRNINAKVQALLAEFNIDFKNAGLAWGNALANGIKAAKDAVGDAAAELAQAAKDNTQNNSPKPKKGPLSKKSMFDAGREHGMNWAKGIASASGAAGKAAATTAGGASGGFGDPPSGMMGNIFNLGGKEPKKYGPDFEGSKPSWADRELWDTIARMAAGQGKFDALIDAVQSGSIKANAGLLSQLFYARTRKTWNDFPARIARILDDMRGPEGLSSAEAAAKYGLRTGGRVLRDGAAWLHKGEDVIPPGQGMRGGQEININFNGTVMGGTEAQLARVLVPAIENEIRRSQRRGNASITQAI